MPAGGLWKLYKNFIVGKDNAAFTPVNMVVRFGLVTSAYVPDFVNHLYNSDIPLSAWAIDDSPSHYTDTMVMYEPTDYTSRMCITTSGDVAITATVDATAKYCVCYEDDNGKLIGIIDLDSTGADVSLNAGDVLHIPVSSVYPIYKQVINTSNAG